jgi:hypothetical protein
VHLTTTTIVAATRIKRRILFLPKLTHSFYHARDWSDSIAISATRRMSTTRQGILAPHVKSLLWLHPPPFPTSTGWKTRVFTHVWIIFQFHLNPRNKAKRSNGCSNTFTASKVRPPRANGKKVGVCLGDASTSSTQSRGTLPCHVGKYNCSR